MSKENTIISLLKEINKNIDNINDSGGNVSKVKVTTFKVDNACINDDGIWEGESLIDTSECTDFFETFKNNTAIKSLDASRWDTSKVSRFYNTFFGCENLRNLNVKGWDVSRLTNIASFLTTGIGKFVKIIGYEDWNVQNVIRIEGLFNYKGGNIENTLDFRKWEIPNAVIVESLFPTYCFIKSLVGGENIESVINNNTTIFKGLKVSYRTGNRFYIEDRASLRALINGLADLTGQTPQTLTLNKGIVPEQTTSAFDTLTEEDIAIATNKNWTITSV